MLFSLDFANNTILSSFFLFFLIIDLHLLISAAFAQILNPAVELVIPKGIAIKEEEKMQRFKCIQ